MFDRLIRGARIYDGTGNAWFLGDVGIHNGRIAAVGNLSGAAARETVAADGRCLAPGFIDIHTHSDFTLLRFPRAESRISQGVTTEVTGNCGFTPFPVAPAHLESLKRYSAFMGGRLDWDWQSAADFLDRVDALPLGINMVPLVGHGSIRIAAMGFANRPPTEPELAAMEALTAEAMEQGTFGLSSGLVYSPGTYCDTAELVALCKVVRRYGGFYATHLRSETEGLIDAVAEALTIGREAGVPVQLSHHKAIGEANWGTVTTTLRMVDDARTAGVDVTLDQYPYTGSSTSFTSFLPPWSLAGGIEALLARLADPAERQRIRDETEARKPMGWDKVLVAGVRLADNKGYEGLTLSAVGAERGQAPVDAGLDLLISEGGQFPIIRFGACEDDVHTVMRYPHVMIGSDGYALSPAEGGKPHPRSYGTFARVLGQYVRAEGVITLEEAIRKMTSLPAGRLGLWDRGLIRPGCAADLVLFQAEAVTDVATFGDPHRFAAGFDAVWVNGICVWRAGHDTGDAAGRVIRRAGVTSRGAN